MISRISISVIMLLLLLASPVFLNANPRPDDKPKQQGFDLNNLDKSATPQTDFYQFAVGGWIKNNPIGDEYSRWGTFEMLQEKNNTVLRRLLEKAAYETKSVKGSAEQKIGDFYATGMDSLQIENDGYKPIIPELKEIDAIKDVEGITKKVVSMHREGSNPLFGLFASVDSKRSDLMAAYLYQGGLTLPDVEYYTKNDTRSKEIRDRYKLHVAKMFQLIGLDSVTADANANTVLTVETGLAKISNTRVENRDPNKTYNKFSITDFKKLNPGFNWETYLQGMMAPNFDSVIVAQPKFFAGMAEMIHSVPLADWKIYLKWNVISDAASALSSAFVNEEFEFSGKYLNGTKAMRPRWKRILSSVNGNIGQLVGQVYVAEVFPPEAKTRAKLVVNNLLAAMGVRIQGLEWMGPETKKAALTKLSTFGVKIGYPDKWKDYSALEINRDTYFANLKRAAEWSTADNLRKIGKPVDKTEWGMSPQTVNAYYSPNRNEIVFPAAILQPPFFNQDADDAINYGAMGSVIGHEISHGFDDQGRKYDELGNLNDWWTNEDNDKFQARTQLLVNQFNNFVAVDTFRVNGSLTLGENIGDLGGLTVSYTAFKKTQQFKEAKEIDGFAPGQRFFLGWAQVWAEIYRPEALKLRLKTDVHSPGRLRVQGPLQNMDEFYDAWNVKPGDAMMVDKAIQAKIW